MLKQFTSYLAYVPRKASTVVLVIAALLLPVATLLAASDVRLETDSGVLNVTQKEDNYEDSTDAKVDEIVKLQVWYHNMEDPNSEKYGENLRMKIELPTEPGKEQVVKSTVSADNADAVSSSATVNTTLDHAYLDYIEGSAEFRYNKAGKTGDVDCQTEMEQAPSDCYVTESISDDVVTDGVVLEEMNNPCFAYEATVTILARVKAPTVTVNKTVRDNAGGEWTTRLQDVKPGSKVDYQIRFENMGNTILEDVMVGDDLPKYHTYVEGSTKLMNTNYPSGVDIENDNITRGGINVGDYMPGSVGYVLFTAQIDDVNVFEKCGDYEVANRAAVRPAGMNEFENWANVVISVDTCEVEQQVEPVFSCDQLSVDNNSPMIDEEVTFTVETTAENGASVKQYSFDFGDGEESFVTDQPQAAYSFDTDGEYDVSVEVMFDVDGETETVSDENCALVVNVQPETPEEPGKPGSIANTGVASALMAITGTSAVGQAVTSFVKSRRSLRDILKG